MARLDQTFYPGQYPCSSERLLEPIPAGTYEVQVVDADLKTTKNLDGQYIQLELSVIRNANPDYNGRKVFANITVSNPSQKAVDIGRAQIMDLCEIFGFTNGFNDTDMLKNRILGVKVKVSDGTPDHPNKRNDVTAYLYPDGRVPGKGPLPSGAPQMSASAAEPAGAPKEPFKRPF